MNARARHTMTLGRGAVAGLLLVGCADSEHILGSGDDDTTPTSSSPPTTTGETTEDDVGSTTLPPIDDLGDDGIVPCVADGPCNLIDILFVVDNSGTMGEEQLNLARNFGGLVDELADLRDVDGNPVTPDVNIMVTTTDYGHPLCTEFNPPDYVPRQGAPVYTGCNSRLQRFTGLGEDPVVIEQACTENCPVDLSPEDHFINFHGDDTNVPGGEVGATLSCIGPQGIDGCGYESPLETMLQALNPTACWNDPDQIHCDVDPEWADTDRGFVRDGAVLAVVIITDEMDCSVKAGPGWSYFTDPDNPIYWNVDPDDGVPKASSAVCFNGGVVCDDDDGDGLYEACRSEASEVLHPISRYTDYLGYLRDELDKEIVMLGILGVPEVAAHNPKPPFEPTVGGVESLVYRDWIDFPYPQGDILPDEWDAGVRAANKRFEFGRVGPGCTGTDEDDDFTGQALPPTRIREVCESLDSTDPMTGEPVVRCCIESICDRDFSPAIRCLTGVITTAIPPIE